MNEHEATQRLIVALDYPTLDEAETSARQLAEAVGVFKIGLELYVAHGPEAVRLGTQLERPIFLDLKLHDIPATVGRAVRTAATLGVRYLTVHAGGGRAMLEAAVHEAAKANAPMDIVAVTVLTSLDNRDLDALGVQATAAEQAVRLARLAFDSGVRAFVCSAQEVQSLRAALGPDATLITPGIRPAGTASGDQKRVKTPRAAMDAGADFLVVGRAIRDANAPVEAARRIVAEMADS